MEQDCRIPREDELVALGKITRTQGHAGAVRLLPFFSPPDKIEGLRSQLVFVGYAGGDCRPLRLNVVTYHKQFVIVSFEEIPDMTAAEQLRDMIVYTTPAALWEAGEEEYFAYELVGMRLLGASGEELGKVVALEDGMAHDYLRVQNQHAREFLVPFVKAFVNEIDRQTRTIRVSLPEGLTEL